MLQDPVSWCCDFRGPPASIGLDVGQSGVFPPFDELREVWSRALSLFVLVREKRSVAFSWSAYGESQGAMEKRRAAHEETGQAWDVVARVKYRLEFDAHVDHLRRGGHNLLEPEIELLHPLLPGAHVVQLQCSHGLDALGLLNAGAASVLGVDISREMVAQAESKARVLGLESSASFIRADAVAPPAEIFDTADVVYTGRGSLPWILDLGAWADSVVRILKPDGHIVLFEGHPLASLWDRTVPHLRMRPGASYFSAEPAEEEGFPSAVVRREAGEDRPRMLERHWRVGEVMDTLIAAGLEIRSLREYPDLFWDQFPDWPEALRDKLPNSYSIVARRPAGA